MSITNPTDFTAIILFAYLIATVVGSFVILLMLWNSYLIGTGRTAIDFLEQQEEREIAQLHGEVYINRYDYGMRKNFEIFFRLDELYSIVSL